MHKKKNKEIVKTVFVIDDTISTINYDLLGVHHTPVTWKTDM